MHSEGTYLVYGNPLSVVSAIASIVKGTAYYGQTRQLIEFIQRNPNLLVMSNGFMEIEIDGHLFTYLPTRGVTIVCGEPSGIEAVVEKIEKRMELSNTVYCR